MSDQVGSYNWAKRAATEAADNALLGELADALGTRTHWASIALLAPKATADRRTFHVLGKPYHYQQDYTGQLKLIPGVSPW